MIYNDDIYDLSFLKFDIDEMLVSYIELLDKIDFTQGSVSAISLNKIPNDEVVDQRGIFWIYDEKYKESQRETHVDERKYTELISEIKNTYFEYIYTEMNKYFELGRLRMLLLSPRKSLSFHRDPEPRIHIPIITNPGCFVVVENFCTHLIADGSTYYTDTRKYHTAFNGGEIDRVHLVGTILNTRNSMK